MDGKCLHTCPVGGTESRICDKYTKIQINSAGMHSLHASLPVCLSTSFILLHTQTQDEAETEAQSQTQTHNTFTPLSINLQFSSLVSVFLIYMSSCVSYYYTSVIVYRCRGAARPKKKRSPKTRHYYFVIAHTWTGPSSRTAHNSQSLLVSTTPFFQYSAWYSLRTFFCAPQHTHTLSHAQTRDRERSLSSE